MNDIQKLDTSVMESVIIQGDLAKLPPADRVKYYMKTCESLGLNPMTKPFDYINLNGRLTLYAKRDATDQLRKLHKISIVINEQKVSEGVYLVTVTAKDPEGRSDSEVGAVPIAGLRGDALSNAIMKAITKAKRRITLSICGLGWTDESEVDSIPGARVVNPDADPAPASPTPPAQDPKPLPPPATPAPAAPQTREDAPGTPKQVEAPLGYDPGKFVIPYGRDRGKTIDQLPPEALRQNLSYWQDKAASNPPKQGSKLEQYMIALEDFLNQGEPSQEPPTKPMTEDDIPF